MSRKEAFEEAAERVKTLSAKPGQSDLLQLYSFYKQGQVGAVQGKRPGIMNVVARAKYDAWASLGDMEQDEAQKSYIELVDRLVEADS